MDTPNRNHIPENTENGTSPHAGWGALILDEAQFVKNTKTRAWKVARALNAQVKLAITGTPMENNLMELLGTLGDCGGWAVPLGANVP